MMLRNDIIDGLIDSLLTEVQDVLLFIYTSHSSRVLKLIHTLKIETNEDSK